MNRSSLLWQQSKSHETGEFQSEQNAEQVERTLYPRSDGRDRAADTLVNAASDAARDAGQRGRSSSVEKGSGSIERGKSAIMKPKKSEQADNQDKATKLKMPAVAMGAWGRLIRSSMPQVTSEQAREQAARTREFRKTHGDLRGGNPKP